jgi:hypothetical protein
MTRLLVGEWKRNVAYLKNKFNLDYETTFFYSDLDNNPMDYNCI